MIEKITLDEYLSGLADISFVSKLLSMSTSNKLSNITPANLCNMLFTGGTLANTDANNVKKSGGYYVTSNPSNCLDWSYLLVFRITDVNIIQINVKNSGTLAQMRILTNDSWSEWKSLF